MSGKWDDPEYVKEYYRKYREEHREQRREWNKKYAAEHRELLAERRKRWRENNPDRIEQYNAKRREARKNKPAGADVGKPKDPERVENWLKQCYSTAHFNDEISWDINLNKYLEGNVNE
jgi:hypothetical protein